MRITYSAAAKLVGDRTGAQELFRETTDEPIELDGSDADAGVSAVERLSLVSSIIDTRLVSQQNFNVFIKIDNTPEGMTTAQELLSGLARSAMTTPSTEVNPNADSRPAITFMPTAGGMTLGLAGGVGLGMALDTLRTTAKASGSPALGNLAIGLGLLGTAIGGYVGSSGASLKRIKFLGFELEFAS